MLEEAMDGGPVLDTWETGDWGRESRTLLSLCAWPFLTSVHDKLGEPIGRCGSVAATPPCIAVSKDCFER